MLRRDRGLHLKEAEPGHAIYCNVANSGTLSEYVAEAVGLGLSEVVVTVGVRYIVGKVAGGGNRQGNR